MSNQKIALNTTEEREYNPKAVFFGENEGIITPLAVYLSARSVDLFAAKELNDAFFGNYFFYIGPYENVKEFVANKASQLPKTALLITSCSDVDCLHKQLSSENNIKLIEAQDMLEIGAVTAGQVMDFFLGSNEKTLVLKPLRNKKLQTEETDFKNNFVQAPEATNAQNKNEDYPNTEKTAKNLNATDSKIQQTQPNAEINTKDKESTSETQEPTSDPKNFITAIASSITKGAETATEIRSIYNLSPKPTEPNKTPIHKRHLPLFSAALLFLLVLIGFPIILIFAELGVGAFGVYQGVLAIKSTNTKASLKYLKIANFGFSSSRSNLNLIQPIFQLTRQNDLYRQLVSLNTVGIETSEGLIYVTKAGESGKVLLGAITGHDKGVAVGPLLSSIKGDLTLADAQLALAEAELKTQPVHDFFSRIGLRKFQPLVSQTKQSVTNSRGALRTALGGLNLLPETLGLFGKRIYLVVFQNNMELRPTGGFIGSYGLLTMVDGQLIDFTIEDVYTADGALAGHVDPPEPIRAYLGQEHWYMRDSNWDPDFSKSAARIAWFLEKEIDVKVDGVIAVNLDFAQSLLREVGEIYLTDFNANVNADNLFELAHKHAQTDFFPGSTQKKDFLGSLSRALKDKLFSSDILQTSFMGQVNKSLRSKDLMVFYVNPTIQALVGEYQWGGNVEPKVECLSCVQDYAMVVDANLGVNKVNYYVNRSTDHAIEINRQGMVAHTLTVTYENAAPPNENGFGDTYTNYVRLLVPRQAQLKTAQVDELELDLQEGALASVSGVSQVTLETHKEIATLLKVPAQKKVALQFRYTTQFDTASLERYVFTEIKQPGVKPGPLDLNVNYPAEWELGQVNDEDSLVAGATTLVKESGITYNTTLSEDKTVDLRFLR